MKEKKKFIDTFFGKTILSIWSWGVPVISLYFYSMGSDAWWNVFIFHAIISFIAIVAFIIILGLALYGLQENEHLLTEIDVNDKIKFMKQRTSYKKKLNTLKWQRPISRVYTFGICIFLAYLGHPVFGVFYFIFLIFGGEVMYQMLLKVWDELNKVNILLEN